MKDRVLLLDGGMGTLLQQAGMRPGERSESWNLSHPEEVTKIHRDYLAAGSNVITSNTFGVNALQYTDGEVRALVSAAVACAREAQRSFAGAEPSWVALDIGPTGHMLKPLGDLDFEDAVNAFASAVRAGVSAGADLILIETMTDSLETKAALLAAKEHSDLPVFVSNAYNEDGRLLTGASPAVMTAMLEGMGADVIGVNCSFGPDVLAPVVREYLKHASVPVLFEPNAGLPRMENGTVMYDVDPESFALQVAELVREGVRVAGGCCGTTPAHIAALKKAVADIRPVPVLPKEETVVTSGTKAVYFTDDPLLIGERINPTGKKRLKQALQEHDIAYILEQGTAQEEKGVHLLDVNVGLPGIDEAELLTSAVRELQAVTSLPLQIDTALPEAMASAMRVYNGKPLVNSVNGKKESMDAIFPLIRKYGGTLIALTLDESGIPADAAGRVKIARKILREAAKYGIGRKDIVFDTLTMTVSAAPDAAKVTLDALETVRGRLGCHTSLGVSNVSFGLPDRENVNCAFFSAALERGLSAAIMNPNSDAMLRVWRAYRLLHGQDANCAEWIVSASSSAAPAAAPSATETADLYTAIIRGLKQRAEKAAAEMLASVAPMDVINGTVIPALNEVGKGFEKQTIWLPQLLMSASAASAAFASVKAAMTAAPSRGTKCRFVLATVKGDVHDIGKNIVRLLLENYGYEVTDLGRDVPPETVVETVKKLNAPLVGLSALMTTTVPAMAETIRLLRAEAPETKVVVGGAVLTEDYAAAIGADHYAPDAMDTVRWADRVTSRLRC
ncbi:MAG: homocysteine S-methyltransferase family protein [Clostridia bacterium]|nr:homocysteine S-methyltransferase family protein [Clostridia bacterium]